MIVHDSLSRIPDRQGNKPVVGRLQVRFYALRLSSAVPQPHYGRM